MANGVSDLTAAQRAKVLHDIFAAVLPHDECALCKEAPVTVTSDDQTFTAAEVQAKVDEALASVNAALEQATNKIADLEAAAGKTEVATAVAEATADLTAKVEQLQTDLDAANAGKKAAEDALAERDRADEEAKEQAALEARRDERATFVTELAIFDKEHVEKSQDRWAAMTDEDWEAQQAEYQKLADKKGITPRPLPKDRKPALTATADDDAGGERSTSAVRAVMDLRHEGVNTRHISVI